MAIDPTILGPMLDPFRNMAAEVESKGYSGENYNTMMSALARMEQLGEELTDFMEFSTKLSTEGLQMTFSTAYGNVLSEAASGSSSGNESDGYDDQALLNQNVDALKQAVAEIKRSEEGAKSEAASHLADKKSQDVVLNEIETLAKTAKIIEPIEALIALGESDISFPTFLRTQIEKGLDKAMDGDVVVKEGIEFELDFAKAVASNPYAIKTREEQLEAFESLAAKSKFGMPNSLSLTLASDKIEHKHLPAEKKWQAIDRAWSRIFSLLDTWVIAHTRFAPFIDPWAMASDPHAAVKRDKETLPGYIQERIRLLRENFDIEFNNILKNETLIWSVRHHHFPYSQVYTTFLIEKALPLCLPESLMTGELIREAENLYEEKQMPNPENYKVLDRQEAVYDKYFGNGQFVQKFGAKPGFDDRAAQAWTL